MHITTETREGVSGLHQAAFLRLMDADDRQRGYIEVRVWDHSEEFEISLCSEGLVPKVDIRLHLPGGTQNG